MGVFHNPPPSFIGGAQPYAPARRVFSQDEPGPAPEFTPKNAALALSIALAAWHVQTAYPQQPRRLGPLESVQEVDAAGAGRAFDIVWVEDPPYFQHRRFVPQFEAAPEVDADFRPRRPIDAWMPAILDAWTQKPVKQQQRLVPQFEAAPIEPPVVEPPVIELSSVVISGGGKKKVKKRRATAGRHTEVLALQELLVEPLVTVPTATIPLLSLETIIRIDDDAILNML